MEGGESILLEDLTIENSKNVIGVIRTTKVKLSELKDELDRLEKEFSK